jgi:hypothetical protein
MRFTFFSFGQRQRAVRALLLPLLLFVWCQAAGIAAWACVPSVQKPCAPARHLCCDRAAGMEHCASHSAHVSTAPHAHDESHSAFSALTTSQNSTLQACCASPENRSVAAAQLSPIQIVVAPPGAPVRFAAPDAEFRVRFFLDAPLKTGLCRATAAGRAPPCLA